MYNKISGFSDEISSDIVTQFTVLNKLGINYFEPRGINGKNISELNPEELKNLKAKMNEFNIKASSIGSPIGKIKIRHSMDEHIEKLKRVINTAHILGTDRIRMFSFYMPHDGTPASDYRNEVIDRMGRMLDVAEAENIILCHENEKGIYGESPENCLDLIDTFGGRLKCVFDPANFLQCGIEVYPYAFDMLGDKLFYLHVKDVDANGDICVAGKGLGAIPEILKVLDARDEKIVLTLEPHLYEFVGLAGLEGDDKTEIEGRFATSADAFDAAVSALKGCIANIR